MFNRKRIVYSLLKNIARFCVFAFPSVLFSVLFYWMLVG